MITNNTTTTRGRRRALVLVCTLAAGLATDPAPLLAAGSRDAAASRLTDLMAKGKLEADLGNSRVAIDAFEAVLRDPAAPAPLRWEALARLGMARKQAGDHEGSVKAFQQVLTSHGDDPQAMRFLTLAVTGVVPGNERWEQIWKKVRLSVERGPQGHPSVQITWPESDSSGSGKGYSGQPISLELKDAALADVLRKFADLSGLDIVLDPSENGTVTMRVSGVPWDEALDRILKSQGLMYRLDGGSMKVARREKLDGAAVSGGKR